MVDIRGGRNHHRLHVTDCTGKRQDFLHHSFMKPDPWGARGRASRPPAKQSVRILLADSGSIQSQLLARALGRRPGFCVSIASPDASALHNSMRSSPADVVLIPANHAPDFGLLRWLHLTYPEAAPVLLVETYDSDLVVNSFRAGAKGLFLYNHASIRSLYRCISRVARGQIWINSEQMHFLLDVLCRVPSLRVVNNSGKLLLTPREEQVMALVAEGLSNREIGAQLGLSEHTIKKYMLRIFDKLGISSRVELVLYALSHGESRTAEWLPHSA